VELIIVVAIIGILSLVVLTSTDVTHKEARDQRREADLKEIQIDLAQYYEYYQTYPAVPLVNAVDSKSLSNFVSGGSGAIPSDPLTGQAYFYYPYQSGGINSAYCVGASLENATPNDNQTADCTSKYNITNASYNYMQEPPQ